MTVATPADSNNHSVHTHQHHTSKQPFILSCSMSPFPMQERLIASPVSVMRTRRCPRRGDIPVKLARNAHGRCHRPWNSLIHHLCLMNCLWGVRWRIEDPLLGHTLAFRNRHKFCGAVEPVPPCSSHHIDAPISGSKSKQYPIQKKKPRLMFVCRPAVAGKRGLRTLVPTQTSQHLPDNDTVCRL
jgi:hypothetical protein